MLYIFILGVRLYVVRSTIMGNAKASVCGTGNGKVPHACCVNKYTDAEAEEPEAFMRL